MSASVACRRLAAALTAVALVPLAGCSDPRAATEANFRKVLQPLVADRFCTPIDAARLETLAGGRRPMPAYPIVLAATPGRFERSGTTMARDTLDAAIRAGLMTRTPKVAMVRMPGDGPYDRADVLVYEPTEKGRAIFRAIGGGTVHGTPVETPARCDATGEVRDIVRWTDPADTFGHVLTTVTYTVGAGGITDAVSDPAEREKLAAPREATTTLQRESDGWHVFNVR